VLPRKIAVVVHRDDSGFESARYLLKLLMVRWQERGITVEIVRDVDRPIVADLLIPHINLTVVPPDYVEFMSEHPRVVNRHLIDISKSRISSGILGPDDSYDGPVIVKTDRNYGGLPEARLLGDAATTLDPQDYPIYDSLADVPAEVFSDEHLVVEKFVPEVDENGYNLRNWTFFGDRGINTVARSNERIVKARNTIDREEVPVPDDLRTIRADLRVDFAKLDYVMKDGKVVLLDVNRTPTYQGPRPSETVTKLVEEMADGIGSLADA
jgi:hypothetical protein